MSVLIDFNWISFNRFDNYFLRIASSSIFCFNLDNSLIWFSFYFYNLFFNSLFYFYSCFDLSNYIFFSRSTSFNLSLYWSLANCNCLTFDYDCSTSLCIFNIVSYLSFNLLNISVTFLWWFSAYSYFFCKIVVFSICFLSESFNKFYNSMTFSFYNLSC